MNYLIFNYFLQFNLSHCCNYNNIVCQPSYSLDLNYFSVNNSQQANPKINLYRKVIRSSKIQVEILCLK